MIELNRRKTLPEGFYFRHFFVRVSGMVIMLCMVAISLGTETQKDDDMKTLFEKKYKAWKEYCKQPQVAISSKTETYIDNEPYAEIVKLGISALPYMMDKVENDPGGHFLCASSYPAMGAVPAITKKKFHISKTEEEPGKSCLFFEEFPDMKSWPLPPSRHKLYLRWWKEGQKHNDQYFEKLYDEWQELKRQNKTEEAKEKYQRIIDLGIAALPSIMQKVEQGDTELAATISELTDGKVEKKAKQSECSKWWKENKEKWLIPLPKPTAGPNEPTAK